MADKHRHTHTHVRHTTYSPQPRENETNRYAAEVAKELTTRQQAESSVPVMATRRNPTSLVSVGATMPVTFHATMKPLKSTATAVEDAPHCNSCGANSTPKEGASVGIVACM